MLETLRARYPFLAERDARAAELSHGERQILELAMALLGEPRLLLLDEPCAGLSPQETAAVIDVIRWASDAARRDHRRHRARHEPGAELADHVFVLHNGSLLAEGSVAAIQADPAVQAIYVGAREMSALPRLGVRGPRLGGYGSTSTVVRGDRRGAGRSPARCCA